MSDNLKTWPKEVFLQHNQTDNKEDVPDYNKTKAIFEFITWSDDRQFNGDIEYIRKDISDERVRELEAKVAQLRFSREELKVDIDSALKAISEYDEENRKLEAERDKIIAETVEKCIQFVENGRFLHDDAPAASLARELVKEMRKQLLPTNGSKG